MTWDYKMESRIHIETIHIENFRSIRNITVNVSQMNVFVGLNDVGKSNILKALNLFFNGQTDHGKYFDFNRDFTMLFSRKSHRAKEIIIELQVFIPGNFKESGVYSWKKTWRRDGLYKQEILNDMGKPPSAKSKIPASLNRIKYRYVPAVKSSEYYKYLLSELYLTAAGTLSDPLVTATRDFAKVIQDYTEQIHDEVSEKIGIDSKLTIPRDMTEMFRVLIFMTSNSGKDKFIPLDMRGDGIQARHIPIVLKYLADKEQDKRSQGFVIAETIWGYEEPENGVELLRAFDVAESFHDYAKQIQIFVTTHSPAFYQQEKTADSKVFYVKNNTSGETSVSDTFVPYELLETMGLMPVVAPLIVEEKRKIERLNQIIKEHVLNDVDTLFVEGKTDKQLLEMAIESYSPSLHRMIKTGAFKIYTREDKGGCEAIVDWVLAWIHMGNRSKTMAIFDKDEAGIKAHDRLIENDIYKGKKSNGNRVCFIEPSDVIKDVLSRVNSYQYEIEHLLSFDCWEIMKNEKWIQERSDNELAKILEGHADKNRTNMDILQELVPEDIIRNTIILCEPKENSKDSIANMIKKAPEENKMEYLSGFQNMIKKIEEHFIE